MKPTGRYLIEGFFAVTQSGPLIGFSEDGDTLLDALTFVALITKEKGIGRVTITDKAQNKVIYDSSEPEKKKGNGRGFADKFINSKR